MKVIVKKEGLIIPKTDLNIKENQRKEWQYTSKSIKTLEVLH